MQNTRTHRYNGKQIPRVVFFTFTFNNNYCPDSEDFFAFWLVRFRDNYRKAYGRSPRYFAISDRGSQYGRLHLHMLLIDPRKYDRKRKEYVGDVSVSELKKHNFWWHYGFVDAQWVKYHAVANYVVGYITGANLERDEPVKHGKPICPEALRYKPRIFVSKGLGASALTEDFIRYVQSRDFTTVDIDGYIYGLPRYYFDKILYQMGRSAGEPHFWEGTNLLGERKVVNRIRNEIIFHRQAIQKAEIDDYYARHRYNPDNYVYSYQRHKFSSSLLASTLSSTEMYLTPPKERLQPFDISEEYSDFVDIVPYVVDIPKVDYLNMEYSQRLVYCADHDRHYANTLDYCPF